MATLTLIGILLCSFLLTTPIWSEIVVLSPKEEHPAALYRDFVKLQNIRKIQQLN